MNLADLKGLTTCNGWVLCDTGAANPGVIKTEATVTRAKLAGDAFLTKLTVVAPGAGYAVGDVVYVLARDFADLGKADNLLVVEGKKLVFVPSASVRLKSAIEFKPLFDRPPTHIPTPLSKDQKSAPGPSGDFILITSPVAQTTPCTTIPPETPVY